MSILSPADVLQSVLTHPTGGVVGLVDELLGLCKSPGLRLDWQADRCRISTPDGKAAELVAVPLRKGAFRAILARVALLCNEHRPNSVSPYGGQGELAGGPKQRNVVFRATFVNTPDEQKLELVPVGPLTNGTAPNSPP